MGLQTLGGGRGARSQRQVEQWNTPPHQLLPPPPPFSQHLKDPPAPLQVRPFWGFLPRKQMRSGGAEHPPNSTPKGTDPKGEPIGWRCCHHAKLEMLKSGDTKGWGTSRFGNTEVWGHQGLGTMRFGDIKGWVHKILGTSRFRDSKTWRH